MARRSHIELLTTATNVVTPYMCKDSNALQRSTNVRCATNMVTSPVYVTKRNLKCIIGIVAETLKHTNYMQVPCMHKTVPITVIPKNPALMNHFAYSYKHKSNQAEGKQIPKLVHLIMSLAYCLKPHHTRNMYLWAWLNMCTDMNIMPASIYQLLFKDLEMKKIKPCKMQISTYTTDTVKIIGSCIFNVVHLDTKKLVPVTFYVANNDGSVLLSCKTTLAL